MTAPKAMTDMASAVEAITREIQDRFRTMGGGRTTVGNPIAAAMAEKPAIFALGVDVSEIVAFVIDQMLSRPPTEAAIEKAAKAMFYADPTRNEALQWSSAATPRKRYITAATAALTAAWSETRRALEEMK